MILISKTAAGLIRWETIDSEVMNRSLGIHHSTIRKLLRIYKGYEQATEGDSFILMVGNALF